MRTETKSGAAHIFRDITDQKDLERALRESEQRLRALVSSTSNIVFRMSPDWSEMLELEGQGFVADTQAPRQNWISTYIYPDDRNRVQAIIRKGINTKTMFDVEHRTHRVSGDIGWVRARAVPLLDDNGEIVEWFGAATDITDRKLAEQHQAMLMAELDHRVKNVLAVVQAIAHQSLKKNDRNGESDATVFVGRIQALAQSHALLAASRWEGARLRDLVDEAVAPHIDADARRVRVTGPGSARSAESSADTHSRPA